MKKIVLAFAIVASLASCGEGNSSNDQGVDTPGIVDSTAVADTIVANQTSSTNGDIQVDKPNKQDEQK